MTKLSKADRVKKDIISMTAQMIHEDGIHAVSIRKLADRVGYAQGTIYNHFKNLDQLLWCVRDHMIREIAVILSNDGDQIVTIEGLRKVMIEYCNYYLSNPNVFYFFYCYNLSKDDKLEVSYIEEQGHQDQTKATIGIIAKAAGCSFEAAVVKYQSLLYTIHGMLLFIVSDNDGTTESMLHKQIDDMINAWSE